MSLNADDYARADAVQLAEWVRRKEVSPAEIVECAIARIDALDPVLNTVAHRLDDMARQTVAHGVPAEGVLAGVPLLVKDTGVTVAGAPMTSGSALFRGNVSTADSTLITRYREAGLVLLGKTNTPELGLSFTTEPLAQGATHNPWNPDHSPGGSSGGAAAAVAAGIVPIAHASDGAGSIRLPSAHCGVFGFKPSRMRVPMGPVIGEALAGMSAPHCITRTVRDSAAMLDASAWPEPGDPYAVRAPERPYLQEVARDPKRLRIGVSTHSPLGGTVHADCRDAVARAAALCAALGHEVEEAEMAYDAVAVKDAWRVIVGIAALTAVQAQEKKIGLRDRFSMLEPVNAAWMRWASGLSAVDYALALNTIRAAGRSCGRSFEMYDVFLTPSAATPPPRLGELACHDDDAEAFYNRFCAHGPFTAVHNATGCPGMSIPMGLQGEGLPVGVHFGAALGNDGVLMALAGQIERAAPWHYTCIGWKGLS